MTKILNKCPVCGSGLQYHSMMQFTEDYKIKLDGTLSKQFFHRGLERAIELIKLGSSIV